MKPDDTAQFFACSDCCYVLCLKCESEISSERKCFQQHKSFPSVHEPLIRVSCYVGIRSNPEKVLLDSFFPELNMPRQDAAALIQKIWKKRAEVKNRLIAQPQPMGVLPLYTATQKPYTWDVEVFCHSPDGKMVRTRPPLPLSFSACKHRPFVLRFWCCCCCCCCYASQKATDQSSTTGFGAAYCLMWSQLAIASEQTVEIRRTLTQEIVYSLDARKFHEGAVTSLAWHPKGCVLHMIVRFAQYWAAYLRPATAVDCRKIIVTGSVDSSAVLWSLQLYKSKMPGLRFGAQLHDRPISCVAFSPTGRYVATACNKRKCGYLYHKLPFHSLESNSIFPTVQVIGMINLDTTLLPSGTQTYLPMPAKLTKRKIGSEFRNSCLDRYTD
eukprot:SAG31_NODE_1527_length_8004_cov_2.107147_5_plen_384_part_00